ncbi:hypothetical protein WJX79_000877 [Trebouxia sp. C0005]
MIPDWKDWVDGNTSEVKRKAERVHDIIHRQSWWRLVEEITDLMRPFVKLLRRCDGDTPVMGQLYWRCSQLYEFVDSSSLFTPAKRQAILAAIKHRRGIMHTDMHRAGYVLDPAFLSHDTLADETVANSFYNVVEKLIPEAETRGTFTNELEKYRQQQGIFARRNNLTPRRANDLVYVFSNLRLAKRIQDLDYQEVVLDWSDSEEEAEED